MKIILITSIVAMVTAGIYGATDMVTDVCSGTMISYDDGSQQHAPEKKEIVLPEKKQTVLPEKKTETIPVAQADTLKRGETNTASARKKPIVEKPEWYSMRSFSRGNPDFDRPYPVEEIVLKPDTTDTPDIDGSLAEDAVPLVDSL